MSEYIISKEMDEWFDGMDKVLHQNEYLTPKVFWESLTDVISGKISYETFSKRIEENFVDNLSKKIMEELTDENSYWPEKRLY